MKRSHVVLALLVVQVTSTLFFVADTFSSLLGLPFGPIDWQARELIQIGATLGLILGIVAGIGVLRSIQRRSDRIEDQLRAASGAFAELLRDRFEEWGLTPAERDVAAFVIKGMSTAEIADLRGTSEGTVKAQTNAIYRKAGVSGRPQLLSLFIDDLLDGPLPGAEASADQARTA
ncbi:MAG: helix-turn-helix transcriptional regulator [Marinibacterium sp.]